MKIAVLSNSFKEYDKKEVEDDLNDTGKSIRSALKWSGHDVHLYDVNERTFDKLRRSDIDFAFNVCERFNGSSLMEPHVAAMLELLQIPYTGSGPLALSLCMNKPRVKEILMHNEIPTPKFQVFYSKNKKLDESLKFPLIVKPVCMDNSIGINEDAVVHNEKDMRSRIAYINRVYNQAALVEEFIKGREFAIAVMGNKNPVALPISEIIFKKDQGMRIYSYDAKWNNDEEFLDIFDEKCPADVPKYIEAKMKKIAVDVYKLLEVKDYGRIDIRLSEDGTPYVLEMNPNPGISADNTIPKAADSLGLSYNEMVNEILYQALERYNISSPSRIVELANNEKVKSEYPLANILEVKNS